MTTMFSWLRPLVRLAGSALVLAWAQACAGSGIEHEGTMPSGGRDAEESAQVQELEARIDELEQRLAESRASATRPTTTVISSGEPASEALEVEPRAPEIAEQGEPVVLRLHETRAPTYDVPVVSERLPVAPLAPVPVVPAPSSAPPTTPPGFAPRAPTAVAPIPSAPIAAAVAPPPRAEELGDYRAGLAHLTGRRYEPAVASLSAFLRDHPGSSQADDALYWRATAQYALRRYREALVDYQRVERIAPRGEHAADAIYHAGLCHRHLGDDAQARSAFARVRREHPDSVAARLAAREGTT